VWPRDAQIGDAALIELIERYLVAKAEHTRLSEIAADGYWREKP
jgi:hypothetical protein